jgi:hypothetical protein
MKSFRTCLTAACAAIHLLGLAACGESQQVTVYKQGKYQGKPDTRPWDSPAYGGDRAKWETGLQARTQNQNEYTRTR